MSLDDLALPEPLAHLLHTICPDEVAARRAALAPWPETDFRSVHDDRTLWLEGARGPRATARRALYERLLREHANRFAPERPYFMSPGTGGTIVSPYPELSNAEYWLFVVFWDTDETTRHVLARSPAMMLDVQTPVQYLRRWRGSGPLPRLRRLLKGRTRLDVLRIVWDAQGEIAHPVYF
jgi:hypothetical protein